MYKIAICIPTYQRPLMLRKLVLSIINSNVNKAVIEDVNIVIVDNDKDKSAEVVINDLKAKSYVTCQLHYFNYPIKGLSNVRNELFKRALELDPDYIACIDDDEYASSDWLNELLLTVTTNRGEIAVGPVFRICNENVPPYISYWFKHHKLIDHQRIEFFETGNFIISVDFLLKNNLKFDKRFNTTGSEDTYFGVIALKKGASIYWAGKAIAYETIPDKRANLKWIIKNMFNKAITYTYILKLEKNYLGLLKKFIVNIIYLIAGMITVIAALFLFKKRYWGIVKLSESLGGFAGLLNIRYHEYKKDR